MRRLLLLVVVGLMSVCGSGLAQEKTAQTIKGPDERFKADILVVVAHPDDEGGVTPYLARAIYDEHKRVAVVYATRGGSGGGDHSPPNRARPARHRPQRPRRRRAAI